MLQQKLTIALETCARCHEHEHLLHSESLYQHALSQIEAELSLTWKLINVLTNRSKPLPRLESFELSYEGILIYSKLAQGTFPKPHDISTLLIALTSKTKIEREFVRRRLKASDLYSYVRERVKSIRLSLKAVVEAVTELVEGREGHQSQIHTCRTLRARPNMRKKKKEMSEKAPRQAARISGTSKAMMNSQKSSKLYSKAISLIDGNILGSRVGSRNHRKSYTLPPLNQKYSYLSKEMDEWDPNFKGQIVLLELSSEEEADEMENIMNKSRRAKLRREEGFSTNLVSKEIGEGNSRKYSFEFQKFTADIEKELRDTVLNQNKKSMFRPDSSNSILSSQVLSEQEDHPDSIGSVSSRDSIEDWPDHTAANEKPLGTDNEVQPHDQMLEMSEIQEAQESAFVTSMQTPLDNTLIASEVIASEEGQKNDDEIRITSELVKSHRVKLKLIEWLLTQNEGLAPRIFQGDQGNIKITSSYSKQFAIQLFNSQMGAFAPTKVRVVLEDKKLRNYYMCQTYVVLAALIQAQDGLGLDEIVRQLRGAPTILIQTVDLRKVKRVVADSYFKKQNRIGQAICLPRQGCSRGISTIRKFASNREDFIRSLLSLEMQPQEQLTAEYEQFAIDFEFILLSFYDPTYCHATLTSCLGPEEAESEYCNPSWKVLFSTTSDCSLFVSYNDCGSEARPTNILISEIVRPKGTKPDGELKLRVIGQINRKGTFFFELSLAPGHYCCEVSKAFVEGDKQCLHFYSSSPLSIGLQALDYSTTQYFISSQAQ